MFLRLLVSFSFLASSLSPAATLARFDDKTSRAYHHITQDTLTNADSCSATAIAPHALLTATHCELGTDTLTVDGREYDITQKIRDGQDHTIYVLPGVTFPFYLHLSSDAPAPGSRVRSWGWPAGREAIAYAEGTFVGPLVLSSPGDPKPIHGLKFSLPSFGGDSGAAIVNDRDEILSVVSLADQASDTLGFPLQFTATQLAAAGV